MDSEKIVTVCLDRAEQQLLRRGLTEWGGPARCSDALAAALGFAEGPGMRADCRRLSAALAATTSISGRDWTTALFATELAFVSDVVGSGLDWESTTGLDDAETLVVLRGLQRKLAAAQPG